MAVVITKIINLFFLLSSQGLQAAADGEFIPAVGYESMDVNVIDCLVLTGLRAPEDGPLKLNRHALGTWSLATLSDLLKVLHPSFPPLHNFRPDHEVILLLEQEAPKIFTSKPAARIPVRLLCVSS